MWRDGLVAGRAACQSGRRLTDPVLGAGTQVHRKMHEIVGALHADSGIMSVLTGHNISFAVGKLSALTARFAQHLSFCPSFLLQQITKIKPPKVRVSKDESSPGPKLSWPGESFLSTSATHGRIR